MSMRRKSYLSYGNLENRNLLAGNVTVVEDGQLYIRGDELSNQFAIVADESGQITVTGLQDTTINGSSEPYQVKESTNLDGARSRNASFDGGLRIYTYGGDDRIDVQGIEFGDLSRVFTGAGNDFVRFLRSTSQDDFVTVTGDGEDTLNFVQARVHGDFNVTTSDGDDSIRIFNSRTWSDTHVFSGAGDDACLLYTSDAADE